MIHTQNKRRKIINSLILCQIIALLPAIALAMPLACGTPQSYASDLVPRVNDTVRVIRKSVGSSRFNITRGNQAGARYDFKINYDHTNSSLSDVIIDEYFRGSMQDPPANEVLYADLYTASQEFGIDIPGSDGAISVPEQITFMSVINKETRNIHRASGNVGMDPYTVHKGDDLFGLYMNTSGTLAKSAARTIEKANEFYSGGAWTVTSLVVHPVGHFIESFQLNIKWVSASPGA